MGIWGDYWDQEDLKDKIQVLSFYKTQNLFVYSRFTEFTIKKLVFHVIYSWFEII